MMRLIKNTVLLGAFIVAWVLALLQLWRGGGESWSGSSRTESSKLKAGRRNKNRWAFRIAAILTLVALGGFLFAASGIMSIKASSRHWAITAWLLNFTMRRSVVTHSLGTETPRLDDPALVLKGAGHYEIGCRPCHGSPDMPLQPRIAQWMTPHPPNLSREIPKWDADELFYIVKHGVKFTGMPAWPAQKRDDEVWAVAAFLLKLPSISADEYRRLAGGKSSTSAATPALGDLLGPQQVPRTVAESCGSCHGVDGSGRGVGAFPKLAGQKPEYFIASMQAFALSRRFSGMMEPIAVGLSREDIAELARFYASLGINSGADASPLGEQTKIDKQKLPEAAKSEPSKTNAKNSALQLFSSPSTEATAKPKTENARSSSAIERGREIAMHGIPRQRVPACAECHGPSDHPRNPHYPILAGQYSDYLVLQLTLFKKQARGGTAYAHLMRPVAAGLTAEQVRDVALFYESLGK